MVKIVIVIPAYNEEKYIVDVLRDIKENVKDVKIIVVDDCSKDSTFEKVKLEIDSEKKRKTYLVGNLKNKGYGGSLITGIKEAKKFNFDVLVTFDGDGQHKAKDIIPVVKPVSRSYGLVIGSRGVLRNKEIPFYRKLGIGFITFFTSLLLFRKISDAQSGFRAYSYKAVNSLSLKDSGMGFSIETLFDVVRAKLKIKEVLIECDYSLGIHSVSPIKHGIQVMLSLIKAFFNDLRRRL